VATQAFGSIGVPDTRVDSTSTRVTCEARAKTSAAAFSSPYSVGCREIARNIVVQLRRLSRQRLRGVDLCRQVLELQLDFLGRVLRRRGRVRDDQGDLLSYIAHALACKDLAARHLDRVLHLGRRRLEMLHVLAGEYCSYPGGTKRGPFFD
jgi:hypothetical protein